MGVINFGAGTYLVKFDDTYTDGLFAVQGETARTFKFIVTDLDNQAIDTSSINLKMNIFVKSKKAGTASSERQEDGSFLMTLPQGLLMEADENAKYQLFIVDDNDSMLAQKTGAFKIYQNSSYEAVGTNLFFDFEVFKAALVLQETYIDQASSMLDTVIEAKDEVVADRIIVVEIKNNLLAITSAENSRILAEQGRVNSMLVIEGEWATLKNEMAEIDVANLILQINNLSTAMKTYVKTATILNGKLILKDGNNDQIIELTLPTYSTFTTSNAGLVPAPSSGNTSKYLKGDGSWANPPDTIYTHPTSAGYKHIPTGGSSGQILGYESSGTAKWIDQIDITGKLNKSGGTMTGDLKASANDNYSTAKVINTATGTTLPSASGFGDGDIFFLYED